jgi:hypothetical protein
MQAGLVSPRKSFLVTQESFTKASNVLVISLLHDRFKRVETQEQAGLDNGRYCTGSRLRKKSEAQASASAA